MFKKLSFFLTGVFFTCTTLHAQDAISFNENIADEIYTALSQCYIEFSEAPLASVYNTLEESYVKTGERSYKYWQAYTKMYTYIYKRDIAELDKSIQIMKNMDTSSSEEYALLAFLKSLKMSSVTNATDLQKISSETKQLAKKSLELDKTNIRAYYVLAALEFYHPKADSEKLKKYLDSALQVAEHKTGYYSVNWGKNLIYELYIKFYLKNNKTKEAKNMFMRASEEFPDDYLINKYYELANGK